LSPEYWHTEYWHIGETPMRLADRMLIRVMTYAFVRVGARSVPGPHCGSPGLDILADQ